MNEIKINGITYDYDIISCAYDANSGFLDLSGVVNRIDKDALLIPKEIVFNEQNKRTTLIFNNGVVRTQTHETDTHDNWFGFLIAMTKHHFKNDNTKYRRFIEQLYSYPKKRMEVALEFFVYNILSSYLSNYQFNKLKNRIQKLNRTESVITFKDFEIKVKLKNVVPF